MTPSGGQETMASSYTLKLDPKLAIPVREFLMTHDFQFSTLNNAFWAAKGMDCRCTFYHSGKLLIQGKEADVWRGLLQEVDQRLTPFFEGLSLHPSPPPQTLTSEVSLATSAARR